MVWLRVRLAGVGAVALIGEVDTIGDSGSYDLRFVPLVALPFPLAEAEPLTAAAPLPLICDDDVCVRDCCCWPARCASSSRLVSSWCACESKNRPLGAAGWAPFEPEYEPLPLAAAEPLSLRPYPAVTADMESGDWP